MKKVKKGKDQSDYQDLMSKTVLKKSVEIQ